MRPSQRGVALDGDYTESRMVVSGPRTNPWYTEASNRPIQAGELLALDLELFESDLQCQVLAHL